MIRRIGGVIAVLLVGAVAFSYAPEPTASLVGTAAETGLRLFDAARAELAGRTRLSKPIAGVLVVSVVVGLGLSAVLPD